MHTSGDDSTSLSSSADIVEIGGATAVAAAGAGANVIKIVFRFYCNLSRIFYFVLFQQTFPHQLFRALFYDISYINSQFYEENTAKIHVKRKKYVYNIGTRRGRNREQRHVRS